MSIEVQLQKSLTESLQAKESFWNTQKVAFLEAASALTDCLKSGNKLMICGNGGSACDALHFTGELVNRYMSDRKGLSCIALTADAPLITCIGNDFNFDHVFSRQVEAHGRKDDWLIAISTSGNSKNVIAAIHKARSMGVKVLALLGGSGGSIEEAKLYDLKLSASSTKSTPRIQEVHAWILHSLCEYIDSKYS